MEDPVALDRDESRADVWSANADLDRVAADVHRLVQLDLEFGIALQSTRYVRLSGNAVVQPVQLGAGRIAQNKDEIARLLRRQYEIGPAGGDPHALRVANDFL